MTKLLIRFKILNQAICQPVGQRLSIGGVNNALLVARVVNVGRASGGCWSREW